MRLIDAEELGEKIEEEFDGICAYDVSPDEAVNDFQDIVDSCKTVDAAPVVHGHWCEDEFDVWCSNCFCACPKDGTGIAGWRKISKYCDNCGAKMEDKNDGR